MSRPPRLLIVRSSKISRLLHILKLLVSQFSPVSYCFIPVTFRYPLRCPTLKHPLSLRAEMYTPRHYHLVVWPPDKTHVVLLRRLLSSGSYIFTGLFLQQHAATKHWRMNHVGWTEKFLLCSCVSSELESLKGTWIILTDARCSWFPEH